MTKMTYQVGLNTSRSNNHCIWSITCPRRTQNTFADILMITNSNAQTHRSAAYAHL